MRTIIIVLASLATAASLALAQTTTMRTPTPTTPSTAQFLVGSWMMTRTPTSPTPNTTTPSPTTPSTTTPGTTITPNGTTGATGTPTPELVTFTATGEALESRPPLITTASGTVFETPGHGAWDFNDAGVFVVTLVALVQPAPTSTATTTPAAQTLGTETVNLQLSANPSDGTLTGTFTSQTRDVNGTVTSSEQGTVQGARILAQTPTATGTTPATGATSTPGAPSTVSATSAPTTVFGNMPSATSVFGAQPTP